LEENERRSRRGGGDIGLIGNTTLENVLNTIMRDADSSQRGLTNSGDKGGRKGKEEEERERGEEKERRKRHDEVEEEDDGQGNAGRGKESKKSEHF